MGKDKDTLTINHIFSVKNDEKITEKLDLILSKITGEIMPTLADIKAKQEDVIAHLTTLTSIEQSILDLVQADSALIASLRQQLADALAGGNPAEIQAVLDSMDAARATMDANAERIKTAVIAGTGV